jgi:beta-N-acetylhexosaminidase
MRNGIPAGQDRKAMATRDKLPPEWDDLDRSVVLDRFHGHDANGCNRQMGQLFMMGFDGTTVNDQIKSLIEDYHVGSILLTAKNLKCAFAVDHDYRFDI